MEKIIVNPERVRCYGNIMMEHSVDDYTLVGSTILVDSDTVMGAETTVYTIEAESSTLSVVLSSSVGSCYLGDTVTLSATVTDDGVAVEGGLVTFKLGNDTIGTDETDSTGVATYTYTTSSVGSLNFTAYYESHNSNTVSVVVSHDYSIAFDSSSYSASDGNVTAYVTLLDNSSPVSGASISLTGTGSTLSATTNSSGIATFNLTGISSDCTLTATYDNVSDTATVTVGPSYLFYDACDSSSGLTNYGTPIMMKGRGGSVELTYDSTNNCYKVNPTSNSAGETMCIPITPMNSKDNYKLTFKIKHGSTVAQNQPSVFVYDNTLSAPTFYGIRYMGNGTMTCHTFNQSTDNGTNSVSYSTGISSKWFTITLQREGTSLTLKVDDENGVNRYNKTHTASGNINAVGFGVYVYDKTRYYYIKDIVAEAL